VGDVMCIGFVLAASLAVAQPAQPEQPNPSQGTQPAQASQVEQSTQPAQPPQPASSAQPAQAVPSAQPAQPLPSAQPGQADQPAPQPAQSGYAPAAAPRMRVVEPAHPAKSRYLVQVMEGVLQSAVRYAAGQMNMKLQAVTPDLLQLSGAARARGFRLDGNGVFFDVEVPAALRQTMGWTARLMQQNDQNLEQAIVQLRRLMNDLDGKRRMDAETALKLVELRARPFLPRQNVYSPSMQDRSAAGAQHVAATHGDPTVTAANAPAPGGPLAGAADATPRPAPRPEDLAWMQNPDGAYEMEVREALISAMLEYGSTLALQPDEWLTVAARDNQSVVVPGDLTETVTVILRIKGSDLADLTAGRLTQQDARRRVEVREF
jgi:hypothetical protein